MKIENEIVFQEILEQSLAGYWDWNIPSGEEYLSPAFKKMFGYEEYELPNHADSWRKLIFPEDLPKVMDVFNKHVKSRGVLPYSIEVRYRHKDGSTVWVICTGKVLEWDDVGNPLRMVGCHVDITKQKQAELESRRHRYYLEKAQEIGKIGTWELDPLKDILLWTEQNYRNFALPVGTPLNYQKFLDCVHPEDRDYVNAEWTAALNGKPYDIEHRIVADGSVKWVREKADLSFDDNGRCISAIGFTQDITDFRHLEKELQKIQKLESLGLLAGGIAHDFNNLLGGIYGYMGIAEEMTTDQIQREYISDAMNTIDRGRHLTQQLLTFAKGGEPVKTTGNLFPHICEITQFALSGSNVSCSFDISPDLNACSFDKNQIAQVIENIIINAKQAMPDGGTIKVSARNISFKELHYAPLSLGDYIQISIRDHGTGIPKEILHNIFDPFYTTKSTGHGLGLATCYSIIKRHGGCITVESDQGKGSTFNIFLPAVTDTPELTESMLKTDHIGIDTIILMDDEEIIRVTVADMLESFGYNVITSENGQEAVDILSSEIAVRNTITALILDLTIPGGMGGKEAISEIRKISTEVPVFVVSGYAGDPVMANPKEYGFTASIRKPFKKSELAELLNKHLVDSK